MALSGDMKNHSESVDGKHLLIMLMVIPDDITSPDELLRRFKEEDRDRIRGYPSGLTLAELERRRDRFGGWIG